MKLRLAAPTLLVDLRQRARACAAIERAERRLADRGDDPPRRPAGPRPTSACSPRARRTIADQQVRNRGTIGGSLAHGDPASDLPAVLLAPEGAVVAARHRRRARDRGAATCSSGLPHHVARPRRGAHRGPAAGARRLGHGYEKFTRRAEDWAMVGVCALVQVERRRLRGRADRPDEHGLDAAAGDRRRGGAARAGARRRVDRPGGRRPPRRAPTRPATSTRRRSTSATWRACSAAGRCGRRPGSRPERGATSTRSPARSPARATSPTARWRRPSSSPQTLGQPLLLEGEAGVGKTEVAKALAAATGARLDPAAVPRGHRRPPRALRLGPRRASCWRCAPPRAASTRASCSPSASCCAARCSRRWRIDADRPVVLLIDEIDRADDAFEAFLLELLARLPGDDPGARDGRGAAPAARRAHLEPHARAARRAQAPLPLPLDRLPGRPSASAAIVARPGAGRARMRSPRASSRPSRGCAASSSTRCPGSGETIGWARALLALGAGCAARRHPRGRAQGPRGPRARA